MTARRLLTFLLGLGLLSAVLAAPVAAQDGPARPLAPPDAQPLADPPDAPSGDGTGVRLATELGDIVIGLFTESSPVASENFVNLVEAGFYDGVVFHRLVPGFVIQGGDPEGTGRGGPGYTIRDEPVVGRYGRGIVAMARTPAPDSQGSQFFIVLDDAAEQALESARTYAIFGRVVEGMDVVDAIAATPNSGPPENTALEPVSITSTSLEQVQLPPEPEREAIAEPGHADRVLEGYYPATIAGAALEPGSFSADQVLAGVPPDDPITGLAGLAEARGKATSDLTIASASTGQGDGFVGVLAARLDGIPAAEFEAELTPLILQAGPDVGIEALEVADRAVRRVAPGTGLAGPSPVYVLVSDEVVWYVLAPEGDLLDEVIAALP
jgi:peptidyl-prolyl cis-trans isomerase B (cyclophilin B)